VSREERRKEQKENNKNIQRQGEFVGKQKLMQAIEERHENTHNVNNVREEKRKYFL